MENPKEYDNLFETMTSGDEMPPIDSSDLMPVEVINISDIETQSEDIAKKLVNKVKKIYFTNADVKADGYANTIIERAISSISLLEKMLISRMQLQDKLVLNISLNPDNTGLYMALSRIGDSVIDIQTQITKELRGLHEDLNEIKQGLISDDDDSDSTPVPESKTAFRGGKEFLKSMLTDDEES